MSEINSIANGTFTIGQTSAMNFQAGPGIKIDEPSAGTVRIGNDETVLWSGEGTTACTLSETPSAFDRIRLYGYRDEGQIENSRGCWEFPTTDMTGFDISQYLYNNENTFRALYLTRYALNGLNFSAQKAMHFYATTAATNWSGPGSCAIKIDKIVGINRISGSNA